MDGGAVPAGGTRRQIGWWCAVAVAVGAGCVDVPERAASFDAGSGADASTDARPNDAMESPPPPEGCLEPLGEVADPPCLRVWWGAPMDAPLVRAAAATVRVEAEERIAVVGGVDRATPDLIGRDTVALYDPATDRWAAAPSLYDGRWGHQIAVSVTGALFVAGGALTRTDEGFWIGRGPVDTFGPGDAAWLRLDGGLDPGRAQGALVALEEAAAIYIGGRIDAGARPSAAIDVLSVAGVAPAMSPLGVARAWPSAVRVSAGRVLVAGGYAADGSAVRTLEFIGEDGAVTPAVAEMAPRGEMGSSRLGRGGLFVGGRRTVGGAPQTAATRFVSGIERVVELAPMAVGRVAPTVTPIGPADSDWRLVVGGESADGAGPPRVEVFDPRHDRFVAFDLPAPIDRSRSGHVAAEVHLDGTRAAVVLGGVDPRSDGRRVDDHLLRPVVFTLEPPPDPPALGDCLPTIDDAADAPCLRVWRGPSLPAPLASAAGAAHSGGMVHVSGGIDGTTGRVSDGYWMLPLGARRWVAGPALAAPRFGHEMLLAGGGLEPDVLVVAGASPIAPDAPAVPSNAIDVLAAGDDRWTLAASTLGRARVDGAVLRGAAESLFLTGGSGAESTVVSDTEIVVRDGSIDRPPLTHARTRHVTCDLAGSALTIGGVDADGAPLAVVELLDPADDAWQVVAIDDPRPRIDAVCTGRNNYVDVFGGRAVDGGPATAVWQRFDRRNNPRMRRGPDLGRPRASATIKRIGLPSAVGIAYLIVGGEEADGDGPATVDLIWPSEPFGSAESIRTYVLPAGIGGRRAHVAVNRAIAADPTMPGTLIDRDVVVLGGLDAGTGAALDEVLVFRLDP